MSRSMFEIVADIARVITKAVEVQSTSDGTTTTTISTALKQYAPNYFENGLLFCVDPDGSAGNYGEIVKVTGFNKSTGTLTHDELSNASDSGERIMVTPAEGPSLGIAPTGT